jgi:hypothetical protein
MVRTASLLQGQKTPVKQSFYYVVPVPPDPCKRHATKSFAHLDWCAIGLPARLIGRDINIVSEAR